MRLLNMPPLATAVVPPVGRYLPETAATSEWVDALNGFAGASLDQYDADPCRWMLCCDRGCCAVTVCCGRVLYCDCRLPMP